MYYIRGYGMTLYIFMTLWGSHLGQIVAVQYGNAFIFPAVIVMFILRNPGST